MQPIVNEEVVREIEFIKKRLSELNRERETLIARQEALKQIVSIQPAILSTGHKIKLFNELFKGRVDVFATRWKNTKGRSGYSVACHNEWVQGICNKPKIKCGECPNRNYKSLDNQAIYEHLSGKQVIGLYPLLYDNKCHLLAMDFDKTDWKDSVKGVARVCTEFAIPHAIEISRSGNGAHIWMFFTEAVLARDARLLGFALLDKAMEIYPGLSFESYDRLFPNQDLLPEGGFGNLIALPLQYQARQKGYSRFVNSELMPYSDQWSYLNQLEKITPQQIMELLALFAPNNAQIADKTPPWEQGVAIKQTQIDNCPEQVTITLANHIYIKLDGLPAALLARLKRLASFSNPVFFKTQALRFSTHGIPRYITCARIEQGYLSLPRGCYDEVLELLEEQNIGVTIEDKRQSGRNLNTLSFLGKLNKNQAKAVSEMLKYNTGVLHAPTAFGKTVAAIGIIVRRKTNTLILTHSRQLLEQWQERLKSFLDNTEIGVIRGGKKKPTGQVDIATYQSLINKKDNTVDLVLGNYGQIIIDECHHISAPRFEMVLNEVRAKFVLGLTATPERQDGHQKIIFMVAGPIRHKVKSSHTGNFEQLVIVTPLYSQPRGSILKVDQGRPRIADVYRWLVEDAERNLKIVGDVAGKIEEGKHPLVLTERREHVKLISQLLTDKGYETVVLTGGMGAKTRKKTNEQLVNAQVIVATGKYIGEGFDLPRLDTLFLALPIAWKGLLAQYAGRIHRESEGKDRVTIFDYVDSSIPMLQRMYQKREKGYKAMGYRIACPDTEELSLLSSHKSNAED